MARGIRGIHDNRTTQPCAPIDCARCSEPLLRGRADGAIVRVDAVGITLEADRLYRLAGRPTFDLARRELVWRNLSRIEHSTNRTLIMVEHRCGSPVPDRYRAPARPENRPVAALYDGEFPY